MKSNFKSWLILLVVILLSLTIIKSMNKKENNDVFKTKSEIKELE
jgi:hypothetical protein